MNKNSTLIVVALDASGSMNRIWDATIAGFNKFLADQKAQPGEANLIVVKFDSNGRFPCLERLVDNRPINEFEGLSRSNYIPRGGTPLYYTQCKLIDEIGAFLSSLPEDQRPGRVLFMTQTDGGDTDWEYHPHYSLAGVKGRIEHQTKTYGWDFSYIGANQDAEAVGFTMGIDAAKCLTYSADVRGTEVAFSAHSQYTTSLRSAAPGADLSNIGYAADLKSQAAGVEAPKT